MASLEYPTHLRYLDSHEYIALDGNTATIGLSAFAIDELGDVVFLELPEVDEEVTKGEPFGAIESVKAAEDLVSPTSGVVIERNDALVEAPENISAETAYGDGWLLKVKVEDAATALEETLSVDDYKALLDGHGN